MKKKIRDYIFNINGSICYFLTIMFFTLFNVFLSLGYTILSLIFIFFFTIFLAIISFKLAFLDYYKELYENELLISEKLLNKLIDTESHYSNLYFKYIELKNKKNDG